MTSHTFPASPDAPREADQLSSDETRADLLAGITVLRECVAALDNATTAAAEAANLDPKDPATAIALRAAGEAVSETAEAIDDEVRCNVSAVAGWLADALDREAGIPLADTRQSIELYQAEDGSWCGRYVHPDGRVSFDGPLPMFTNRASSRFVLAAMTATHVSADSYAAVRLVAESANPFPGESV